MSVAKKGTMRGIVLEIADKEGHTCRRTMTAATLVGTTVRLLDGSTPVRSGAQCDSVSALDGAPSDKPSTDTRIEGVCWIVCC